MTIYVKIKSVYGKDKYYPCCSKGKAFAKIAGTKTLTEETIKQIQNIGFTVKVEVIPWW